MGSKTVTNMRNTNASPLVGEEGARELARGKVRGQSKNLHSEPLPPHPTAARPPSPARGEGVLLKRAKQMRKEMTPAERALWKALRDKRLAGYKFRRQVPIGNYIVDFVCFSPKLIVESDGGQHCDNEHDKHRDTWLKNQGFVVMRFWNLDVLKAPTNVVETILNKVEEYGK